MNDISHVALQKNIKQALELAAALKHFSIAKETDLIRWKVNELVGVLADADKTAQALCAALEDSAAACTKREDSSGWKGIY